MKREFYIVDVFAEEKYAGNQLAVFPDGHLYADDEMQRLAREMHFSETVFLFPAESSGDVFKARIFTPAVEIPFAGHPSLGAAYIVSREILRENVAQVVLDLPAGRIPISLTYGPDGEIEWLTMKQLAPRFGPLLAADTAAAVLNAPPSAIDDRFPAQEVSTGTPFLIVPLRTLPGIRSVQVNLAELGRLFDRFAARAVLVFCPETVAPKNALHMRVFADFLGVPEDPACGSGAGCLAGYLVRYGYFGDGPIDVTVEQGYEVARPSLLRLAAQEADGAIKVFVGGRVFPVARGYLI